MLGCCGLLLQGPPHKCALFFVDNSGVDIILGVMPFVRELLSRGTEVRNHGGGQEGLRMTGAGLHPCFHPQVVLASNSGPALNDVTNGELQILTERIAAMDPVIR